MRTALLAGSTGLIGREVLSRLFSSPAYARIYVLSRKNMEIADPRVSVIVTDLSTLKVSLINISPDDVFCCVGTTMAKAGSKEKFYEADFRYPFELAQITRENGANKFLLVSALGADKDSAVFYNQVKGEIEEAIATLGFESFHILRPSLLLGDRSERRPGEDAAKTFFRYFGFLVPAKYKAIHASDVAASMIRYSFSPEKGTIVHESKEMRGASAAEAK